MSRSQPAFLAHARHRDLPALDDCALLLIDWQRAFLEAGQRTFLPDAARALRHAIELMHAFEEAHKLIVITRHAHLRPPRGPGMGAWWSSFLMEGDPASALVDPVRRCENAMLLRKSHYSAFRGTGLRRTLQGLGVRTVVLAGVMTHVCVDSTARDAFMSGFDVVVVHDSCASRDRSLHEGSLLTLAHAVARVTTTRIVLKAMDRGRGP